MNFLHIHGSSFSIPDVPVPFLNLHLKSVHRGQVKNKTFDTIQESRDAGPNERCSDLFSLVGARSAVVVVAVVVALMAVVLVVWRMEITE
ncbi:hypothetical protein E2C01_047509 [Portunus trituberculatus]|uniref:Uncharacterized protein n=1 Tax=Portunus trituberculatus TaxID=210409 RepID=A0A5B7G923_PORTR|nr:hypothetical protein [Portunus trituberculatus]